jgi:hypothetical protein
MLMDYPREIMTSRHVPSGILNTQYEHEAKVPMFRGRLGFRSGMSIIEAVREKGNMRLIGSRRCKERTMNWNAY